jgi:hypothetical protein
MGTSVHRSNGADLWSAFGARHSFGVNGLKTGIPHATLIRMIDS